MTASAHQIATGVLAGLHACDEEHDRDGLLGYAGDMDSYAHSVFTLLDQHRLPLPDELCRRLLKTDPVGFRERTRRGSIFGER